MFARLETERSARPSEHDLGYRQKAIGWLAWVGGGDGPSPGQRSHISVVTVRDIGLTQVCAQSIQRAVIDGACTGREDRAVWGEHIDPVAVETYLAELPGVTMVHDLHIWAMSTTETALTAHLVMPGGHPGDAFLVTLADELVHRFRIGHPTIQIEIDGLPDGCVRPARLE